MKTKQKYWFKRKRYGYGWVPSSWEGMAVLLGYVVIMLLTSTLAGTVFFYIIFGIATIVLLVTTYKKGPSPKWRWGSKPEDDRELDF